MAAKRYNLLLLPTPPQRLGAGAGPRDPCRGGSGAQQLRSRGTPRKIYIVEVCERQGGSTELALVPRRWKGLVSIPDLSTNLIGIRMFSPYFAWVPSGFSGFLLPQLNTHNVKYSSNHSNSAKKYLKITKLETHNRNIAPYCNQTCQAPPETES